jgi:hypothetical protein
MDQTGNRAKAERNEELWARYRAGEPYTRLASEFKITPHRVRVIVTAAQRRHDRRSGADVDPEAIMEADLPPRTWLPLRAAGIRRWRDLAGFTAATLDLLPGIGPSTARTILEAALGRSRSRSRR